MVNKRYTYKDITEIYKKLEQLEEELKNGKHTTPIQRKD